MSVPNWTAMHLAAVLVLCASAAPVLFALLARVVEAYTDITPDVYLHPRRTRALATLLMFVLPLAVFVGVGSAQAADEDTQSRFRTELAAQLTATYDVTLSADQVSALPGRAGASSDVVAVVDGQPQLCAVRALPASAVLLCYAQQPNTRAGEGQVGASAS